MPNLKLELDQESAIRYETIKRRKVQCWKKGFPDEFPSGNCPISVSIGDSVQTKCFCSELQNVVLEIHKEEIETIGRRGACSDNPRDCPHFHWLYPRIPCWFDDECQYRQT